MHEFCGESGAIGAAAESLRLWRNGQQTTFVGLDAVRKIQYRTTRNEATRCNFCKNNCLRTFIDIRTAPKDEMSFLPIQKVTKVPLMHGEQRLIIATCEKGLVEDVNDMKDIKAGLDEIKDKHPNFVDYRSPRGLPPGEREECGRPNSDGEILEQGSQRAHSAHGESQEAPRRHSPRAQHLHLRAALQRIPRKPGRAAGEYLYSDYTSSDLYRAGASRGAIDPCFPAKIGISHVYNLIQEKHRKKPLNVIFFPMYDVLTSPLVKIVGANACPTVTATPETVKAAFTKENDVFAEHNVKYVDPVLNFADRKLFAHQMLQAWQPILGLSQEENDRAVEVGLQGAGRL